MHNVEGPVNQRGGVTSTVGGSKDDKLKKKMEIKRMSRKQRRVREGEELY